MPKAFNTKPHSWQSPEKPCFSLQTVNSSLRFNKKKQIRKRKYF